MKLILEFEVDQKRRFRREDLEEDMAGAMPEFESFEGAGVTCKLVSRDSGMEVTK